MMTYHKCRRFIVHYASLTCNSTRPQHTLQIIQSVLITGFQSLPGLPGVKGLIAACIWRNPSSSNSHPHRICKFRTLSPGLDSNADDQYSQLKRFIVRDLTDSANEPLHGQYNSKTTSMINVLRKWEKSFHIRVTFITYILCSD